MAQTSSHTLQPEHLSAMTVSFLFIFTPLNDGNKITENINNYRILITFVIILYTVESDEHGIFAYPDGSQRIDKYKFTIKGHG